jgi:3-oxoacyl-[acyl-carrier protein] reductase
MRLDCRFDEFHSPRAVKHRGIGQEIRRKRNSHSASLDGDGELGVETRPGIDKGLRTTARLPVEAAGGTAYAGAFAANKRLGGRVQPIDAKDFGGLHVPLEAGFIAEYSESNGAIGACRRLRYEERSRHRIVVSHVHEGGVIERLVGAADMQLGTQRRHGHARDETGHVMGVHTDIGGCEGGTGALRVDAPLAALVVGSDRRDRPVLDEFDMDVPNPPQLACAHHLACTITAASAELIETFGSVDILVNNAGVLSNNKILDTSLEGWRRVSGINFEAAFLLIRAFLPGMRATKWGRIINMSSYAAKCGGLTAGTAHSVSKSALIGLTFATARETARDGITANAIALAYVMSPMVSEQLTDDQRRSQLAQIPVGRFCTPEEVAHAVLFLASPLAGFITGEVIDMNGGLQFD